MKRFIITIASLFLSLHTFCQECFLHLKAVDTLKFQTWDTLYATFYNNTVIIKDFNGIKRKFVFEEGYGPYFSDMVISSGGRFHACGNLKKGRCRSGKIFMDEKMKLYFENKSHVYKSSHRDHGSHMSHYSSF